MIEELKPRELRAEDLVLVQSTISDAKKEIEKIKKYYANGENPHFLLGALIGKLEEILP